jgi:putative copper resistance protein D
MGRVEFSIHNALTRWEFSAFPVGVVLVLVAIAVWYLWADWRLAARGRRWSGARTASFMCGLVVVDLALQSPVAAMTGTYFEAHVLQHLLLMVVAPPLLALGAPSTLLLQTGRRKTKQRWLRVLRSAPFALISHPVVAWGLYYGAMFVFFLTSLLNFAMLHMWLMDIINVIFLFGATLFWWPMVGIDPIIHWKMSYPARMLNILLGSGVEAFLGVAILNSHKPLASMYTLSSTKAGGGLLWAATEFVTLGAFIPIFFQWMHSEDRAAARADARGGASMSIIGAAASGGPELELAAGRVVVAAGAGGVAGASPNGSHSQRSQYGSQHDDPPLTAWEYAWKARTGSVPTRFVAPEHAPGPADLGDTPAGGGGSEMSRDLVRVLEPELGTVVPEPVRDSHLAGGFAGRIGQAVHHCEQLVPGQQDVMEHLAEERRHRRHDRRRHVDDP